MGLSSQAVTQTPQTTRAVTLFEGARLIVGDESAPMEMAGLVKAGFTPTEAIGAATRNPAELFGLDELGTIVAGKSADFIVLNANPLDDIANTRRIAKVYLRGKEVDRA